MVKPGYQKNHLMDMLRAPHIKKEDRTAIRFALWGMHNPGLAHPKPDPKVPYWRYVDYADDGCSIYQCLDCKETWEARTPPGTMEYYDRVERELIKRDPPVYHPNFNFCPYCGIKWDGPIRRDYDNEYMYGPKRLARRERGGDETRKQFVPGWWMVIQAREIWKGREPEKWNDKCKFSPYRHSPQQVMDEVNELRESDKLRSANDTLNFGLTHEYRATTRSQKEMAELYPVYWQELNERR